MKQSRNRLKTAVRKTATGAILSAAAAALLIMGAVLEILDMTCAAVASAAVLIAYIEFGAATAFSVYAASSVLTLILMPMASSVFYFVIALGYYPVLKLFVDRKLSKHKLLRMAVKFAAFNAACALILFIFTKLYGLDTVMAELNMGKFSFGILAAVLNVFLVMYDLLIGYVTVIYIKLLRPRIFPRK